MIRKFALAATALVTITGTAFAADLPSRKAPPVYAPPPPIFTWTGVYIGGQIGYAWGRNNTVLPLTAATTVVARSNPEGVVGGAHVGYNYQVQQFVFGLEGDVEGTSFSKSVLAVPPGTTIGTRIPVQGSVRGRIGYAFDRTLFYATGGVAFASIQNSFAGGITPYFSNSNGRVGWTVGGGVEYAVTNNWSVRGEYRYSDFGHNSTFITGTAFTPRSHVTEHAVRVGFSYKFDMYAPPAPVVAKY